MESHPNNIEIKKEYNWVCKNLNYANQKFHQSNVIFLLDISFILQGYNFHFL